MLSPAATGLTFTNTLDEWAIAANRVLTSGSGVAAGDFDNDGWVDLFFAGLNSRNRLFKNLGQWTFEDVTLDAGLNFPPRFYRSAVFADLDGDGWLDLLVGTVSEGVLCLLNDRQGHFRDVTSEAGTASPYANQTIALADVDGNGTLDLYAANNRQNDIRDWPRVPVMFVNKKPTVPPQLRDRLTFESGQLQEYGEPDLFYLNDGRARFTRIEWTNGWFLGEQGQSLKGPPLDWSLTAAFRDLNDDNAPDLYVCSDYWTPDRLWQNDGTGRFQAVRALGVRRICASSMGVDFADINRDGHVDVFAVDMLSRSAELRKRQMVGKRPTPPRVGDIETRVQTPQNTLLLNRGDGTFAEIACLAGVEASDWSWSPVFLDGDLDGFEDLLITAGHVGDIQDLDANDRIRLLQDAWRRSPMAATNLQRAFVEAKREHARLYPPLPMPIVAFRNLGTLRFEEVTLSWGLGDLGVNHGMALADLDNDGDLDLAVNRLGLPAALFRNDTTAPRVAVRLRGRPPNTQAIGATIELGGGPVPHQKAEVTSGGSFMSGHDALRVFASGASNAGMVLRITWRDGRRTEVSEVKPNRLYQIDEEKSAVSRPLSVVTNAPSEVSITRPQTTDHGPRTTLFTDVSSLLNHTHHEEPFDDFARQPLLPRKLSQGGPGVSWFDLNQDGWEDLIIGSGRGGTLAVYRNDRQGGFTAWPHPAWNASVPDDLTGIIGWTSGPRQRSLLVALASYESGQAKAPALLRYDFPAGDDGSLTPHSSPLTPHSSPGPLALADLDADGALDLFVGGQVVPGRYPEPASSLIFRGAEAQWSLDPTNSRALAEIGLVNGAVWSDLDGDGFPELVLASEWGPLKIFRNIKGQLHPWDWPVVLSEQGREQRSEVSGQRAEAGDERSAFGTRHSAISNQQSTIPLRQLTGLWTGVTAGDLDSDGRMDLLAGNWGLNSRYRASPAQPMALFYGPLTRPDSVDIVEAEFDPARKQHAPRHLRDMLAAGLPFLAERFTTHAAFSRATVPDLIRDRPGPIKQLTATTLSSTAFLNRGGTFEVRELPLEAQFAPAFGICIGDLDGDGHEDVFLSQNFFAFRLEDSRLDAGRGLVLRGDGQGALVPLAAQQSGVMVYGEQRGAALADFDHDARVDLVITQNGAPTRLYHNSRARPGLRIRLVGPPGNPDGIGAVVRVKFGAQWGPAREVHAGSGWWSQDSAVSVLGLLRAATAVWVRWPGGQISEVPLEPGQREVTVRR